jgi:hypothetical protein
MALNSSYKSNQGANMSQLDRLNRLTDKLNSSTMDSAKNSKFAFLNSRIADLNEHLDEIVDQTNKKFGIIKENVNTIYIRIDIYIYIIID